MALSIATLLLLGTGPFAPAAGLEGSTAIPKDHPAIIAWADDVADYSPGEALDSAWMDTSRALGPAQGNVYQVLSLGRGGSVTFYFSEGIANGEGWDFVVFSNAFDDYFLELAFVEVSSNGQDYHRFPTQSLTTLPVPAFGQVDTTQIDGFAGKYRVGFGTPFDLSDLAGTPGLDLSQVRYLRLIDVVGNGSTRDSGGRPVYAPYPTVGSAGFDLDGIGIMHQGFLRGVWHDEQGIWTFHPSFGWYYGAYYPWIFYPARGWLYVVPTADDSFWVWSAADGWSWTESRAFPMAWNETQGWGLF